MRPILAAAAALFIASHAASGASSGWGTTSTGALGASAESEKGGQVLVLACDENNGFEINMISLTTLDVASPNVQVITDSGAPITLPLDIDMAPAVRLRHAEPAERAIFATHRIGIRIDGRFGSNTYYFDFRDLSTGKDNVLKMCPA